MNAYRVIWKYTLPLTPDPIGLALPQDAEVLQVQIQRGAITLWAEVDPAAAPQDRWFVIHGTGHPFRRAGLHYLATVQLDAYVWHVYEAVPGEGV